MQLAERCLDCPLALGDAIGLVVVSLALLLFGRVLLSIPRTLLKGFGVVGLGASLILHAFGLSTIALLGIAWPHPGRLPDALFAGGWLVLSVLAVLVAARIGRAFPVRSQRRLHAVEGSAEAPRRSPATPHPVDERRRAP